MGLFARKNSTLALDESKSFIILNFKTYKEATGENALRLAKIAQKVQSITHLNIIICPQAIDLSNISSNIKIPVYAQHVDCGDVGKNTGSIIPQNLSNINVHGTLLNHSEKKIGIKTIQKTVLKLKELDMRSIVCAENYEEAKKIMKIQPVKPDFIAIEPPELIGGEISISAAKPGIISKAVKLCAGNKVLVGAGIKDNKDIQIAIAEGAKGVLLSSHYVLAQDPEKFLLELTRDVK